jgi:hypothetical protein
LESQLRSPLTFAAINAAKSSCPRGHPYDHTTANGWRRCGACERGREQAGRAGTFWPSLPPARSRPPGPRIRRGWGGVSFRCLSPTSDQLHALGRNHPTDF